MEKLDLFATATRLKVRFESTRGLLTTEDLWDLPLKSVRSVNLNDLAIGLNRDLKASGEEDFVDKTSTPNQELQMKFEIVKHIIDVKLAENEDARLQTEKKQKKARLLELIAKKQDADLEGKPLEELMALANEL